MKQKIKRILPPKLRFPEFRDAGEWTRHTLSHYVSALDAGVSVNGGDRPARNGEIGVLKTSCVTTGTFDRTENKVVLEPEELGRVKESVQRDTIIMSRMNTIELVGANAYIEREITNLHLPDRLWAAKPTTNGNMRFLSYILGSDQGRAFLSSLASGSSGSMKNISKSEVLAMPISVPSIAEQQRITACLSSLDELIAAEGRTLEVLKNHKLGLMQQLFPQPGQTQPRLRFPEFRDKGEWREEKLSRHIKLVSGVHLSPSDYSDHGQIPYFTGPSDFTNAESHVSKWTTQTDNKGVAHDILITVKGSGVGELWYLELPQAALGRQLMAVRPSNGINRFYFQLLLSKRRLFEDLAMGNLIPGLSRGDILNLKTPLPREAEQQKIADCLSSLDTQIAAQAAKIETLKQHKRGLMQQLFPAPEYQ